MALYPPRTAGTDALVRIYNNDGSEAGACGNGMRCVASLIAQESGKDKLTFEIDGRPAQHLEERRRAVHRRHGRAALCLERDSARRGIPRHPRHRIADRPDRQADPAFAVGRQHGQSARDLLGRRRRAPTISPGSGRCWKTIRCFPSAPTSRSARSQSKEHIVIRTWERGAGLTRACGSAACAAAVAAARLKRTGRKVRVTLPGGDLTIDWRESDDHVLMTGPVEFEFEGTLRSGAVRQGRRGMSRRCRHLRLPAQHRRIRGDAPRGRGGGRRRCRGRQHLRGDRRSGEAGAPDHPQLRRERPDAKIVVTGCAAQTEPQIVRRDARSRSRARQRREAVAPRAGPALDAARKESRVGDIMAATDARAASHRRASRATPARSCRCRTAAITAAPSASSRSAAAIRARSRWATWWRRCARLVENGAREIVLTGVDITSYGRPAGARLGCW